tara:strand:+ start:1616 stop:2194 length:579 start_codon:yes stop_codon:yes gene_type:complete
MTVKHLKHDDCVLEFGGSIGRNSCVINTILSDKTKHVVVEPSTRELNTLLKNRERNKLGFLVENSAISDVQLYSKVWNTYDTPVNGSVPVKCITYDVFKKKYNLPFNVIVIDSEGSFVNTMKTSPDILDNIRMIIMEHDFITEDDYEYFKRTLVIKGYKCKYVYLKKEQYGPGMNWCDGLKSDPIFVSVWKS